MIHGTRVTYLDNFGRGSTKRSLTGSATKTVDLKDWSILTSLFSATT
jgi:hypothetical protein